MKIFAHRGASGSAPENTMSAFELALATKCYGIELDVQMTCDGEIVVIHDEEIARTSNSSGLVMDKSLSELKSYDFGSWFSNDYACEKIPTLIEVLDWLMGNELVLNIEIKPAPIYYKKELTEKTISYIKQRNLQDRIIISSFNHQALKDSKQICPQIKLAALLDGSLIDVGGYCRLHGIDYAHPQADFVDENIVKSCRDNGVEINVWTVNSAKVALRLKNLGVQGIITNFPEAI